MILLRIDVVLLFYIGAPAVDAAYAAGLAAGGRACDDAPSWHDGGPDGRIYLGSLLDPSGNKICVLHQPHDAADAVAVEAAAQPA